MKAHKNMKQRKNKDKNRFTVCLDKEIAEKLYVEAEKEDRKPAALLALFAKRALLQ